MVDDDAGQQLGPHQRCVRARVVCRSFASLVLLSRCRQHDVPNDVCVRRRCLPSARLANRSERAHAYARSHTRRQKHAAVIYQRSYGAWSDCTDGRCVVRAVGAFARRWRALSAERATPVAAREEDFRSVESVDRVRARCAAFALARARALTRRCHPEHCKRP